MSYYDEQSVCPKCGQLSSTEDICDSCGALISRIRERQFNSPDAENAVNVPLDQPQVTQEFGEPQGRMSLTSIAMVVLLAAVVGGIVYIKSDKSVDAAGEISSAASYAESTVEEQILELPEATPIYDFAKAEPQDTNEPEIAGATASETASQAGESESPGVFELIAGSIKAQAAQQATAPPAASDNGIPAAPAPQIASVPEPTAASQAPISQRAQKSTNNGAITIGEGEITSSNFSIKASESAPAKAGTTSTPAGGASQATPAQAPAAAALGKRKVEAVDTGSFTQEVLFHTGEPVLVDFYATWCGPCKRLAPQLEVFAGLNDKLKVVKLDIDQSKAIATKYKIRSVPTLILFKNGRELGRSSGVPSMAKLQASVQPHL